MTATGSERSNPLILFCKVQAHSCVIAAPNQGLHDLQVFCLKDSTVLDCHVAPRAWICQGPWLC